MLAHVSYNQQKRVREKPCQRIQELQSVLMNILLMSLKLAYCHHRCSRFSALRVEFSAKWMFAAFVPPPKTSSHVSQWVRPDPHAVILKILL